MESMWKGRPLSKLTKAELIEAVEQLGVMIDKQAADAVHSLEVLTRSRRRWRGG